MSADTLPAPPNETSPAFNAPQDPELTGLKGCPLFEAEIYWRDRYLWLKEHGYLLRSRYHPEWVPSWKLDTTKHWYDAEDSYSDKVRLMINHSSIFPDIVFYSISSHPL